MLLYVQKKSKALCSPERQAGGRAGQLGLCLGTLVQHEHTLLYLLLPASSGEQRGKGGLGWLWGQGS